MSSTRTGFRPNKRIGIAAALAAVLAAPMLAAQPAETSLLEALLAALSAESEDGIAAVGRYLEHLDPMLRETAAPLLAGLIEDSRDDALQHGVEPIPATIRAELAGYVPDDVLDAARWCVGCGGDLSLQRNTFRFELSPAITLDHVIVFKERDVALHDPSLWAHELKHVMQYRDWGIAGFAAKYVADYEAVEHEAAEYRWEWMKRTGFLERRQAALSRDERLQ